MRAKVRKNGLAVHAIAGTHTVLLGLDATRKVARGLLGFAIYRQDDTEGEGYWLKSSLAFAENATGTHLYSQYENPIQTFRWGDYTAKPDHRYCYQVVPVYGKPKWLKYGSGVSVHIATESVNDETHRIFFNRSVAGSQAFVREFGPPDKKKLNDPESAEHKWLSRGLEEAMLAFINEARDETWAIHGCLYEFAYQPILRALGAASKRGVEVKITYDARGAAEENEPEIKKARVGKLAIPRKGVGIAISHNKVLILLKDEKPFAVWTGSTNVTLGGLIGQSNVGHAVYDAEVAQIYYDYFQQLSTNPPRRTLAPWNDKHTPLNDENKAREIEVVFSPRTDIEALDYYATLMSRAKSGVFLTAAFGVSTQLTAVLQEKKRYLRYLLMDNPGQRFNRDNTQKIAKNHFDRIALGDVIRAGALADWHRETLTGLNAHVRYLHTKYMLIDPLGAHPIVISGSANFSEASTMKNDENMLIIRDNRKVADIYLTEYMRLFDHFSFRDKLDSHLDQYDGWQAKNSDLNIGKDKELYLAADATWSDRYYLKDSVEQKERLYFAGK